MRIRVIDVLELLAAGESHQQILRDYPYLESDDVAAWLLHNRLGRGKHTLPQQLPTSEVL
jgi:uncharacterized protein (DUF433 family)